MGRKVVKIAWIHIGIGGNEKADRRASYESFLGDIRGTQSTQQPKGPGSGFQGNPQGIKDRERFRDMQI